MDKLISEEPLPTGGVRGHPGRKMSLSAASPKASATMSFVPQHPPFLTHDAGNE